MQQSQAESSFEDAFGHVDPYTEAEESIGEEPLKILSMKTKMKRT